MSRHFGFVVMLSACASAPAPAAESLPPGPSGQCGNSFLHEQFEKELAAAQATPDPDRRAVAICQVAHDWHIEDCSNVTADSLNLP